MLTWVIYTLVPEFTIYMNGLYTLDFTDSVQRLVLKILTLYLCLRKCVSLSANRRIGESICLIAIEIHMEDLEASKIIHFNVFCYNGCN